MAAESPLPPAQAAAAAPMHSSVHLRFTRNKRHKPFAGPVMLYLFVHSPTTRPRLLVQCVQLRTAADHHDFTIAFDRRIDRDLALGLWCYATRQVALSTGEAGQDDDRELNTRDAKVTWSNGTGAPLIRWNDTHQSPGGFHKRRSAHDSVFRLYTTRIATASLPSIGKGSTAILSAIGSSQPLAVITVIKSPPLADPLAHPLAAAAAAAAAAIHMKPMDVFTRGSRALVAELRAYDARWRTNITVMDRRVFDVVNFPGMAQCYVPLFPWFSAITLCKACTASPNSLERMVEVCKMRMGIGADENVAKLPLAEQCELLASVCTLIPVTQPYVFDRGDVWTLPQQSPFMETTGIDCEDGAAFAHGLFRAIQMLDTDTLKPDSDMYVLCVLSRAYVVLFTLGVLSLGGRAYTYHAFNVAMDRRLYYTRLGLDPTTRVDWPVKAGWEGGAVPPILMETTADTASAWAHRPAPKRRATAHFMNTVVDDPDRMQAMGLVPKLPPSHMIDTKQYTHLHSGFVSEPLDPTRRDALVGAAGLGHVLFTSRKRIGVSGIAFMTQPTSTFSWHAIPSTTMATAAPTGFHQAALKVFVHSLPACTAWHVSGNQPRKTTLAHLIRPTLNLATTAVYVIRSADLTPALRSFVTQRLSPHAQLVRYNITGRYAVIVIAVPWRTVD